ncbi:MAG: hypothetical protein Q8M29_07320 [Bacteroidota bacterium]|nr:hypothetical protein [Bacteroidota bacterium]
MKKLLAIAIALIISTAFVADNVYVCDSKTSVAYHATKDCKGLNRCTHEIIHISKTDAVSVYNKRACKICY